MRDFNLSRITMGILLAILLLTSSFTQAKVAPENDLVYENWRTLGNGYVARRKVPSISEVPLEQRQPRPVEDHLLPVYGKKINRGEANMATMGTAESSKDKALDKPAALWLRTGIAGLYGVSVEDLAAELEATQSSVRNLAANGLLSLSNAGATVYWYFDASSDTLLFAGETYENFYTDVNAYLLNLNPSTAHPMPVTDAASASSAGSRSAFKETLKFEEEPDYYYATWSVGEDQGADYWWWDFLQAGYRNSINVPLQIPDPASTGSAQIRITLRGFTDVVAGNEHTVRAEINGEPVGSAITWDAFDQVVLKADFDQAILNPGGNNTLRLSNSYAPGTRPGQWLDEVEVDYYRLPVAQDGMLWLRGVAAGTQQVTGFADEEIIVIESPTGSSVLRQDARIESGGAGGLAVTFETTPGADYLVAEVGTMKMPSLTKATGPRLKSKLNRADYLVIAPREFEGTATLLAGYRSEQFTNVEIAWLDEIYAEFSHGRVDPYALGRFMTSVKDWKISPRYVVIIGKGSLDEKNRMRYYDSHVPVLMTATPWSLATSDQLLLAGEESAPYAIGRLPITNDLEGMAYVDKLINFETTVPGEERHDALLVADNPDKAGDFHLNSDLLAERLVDNLGFNDVRKLYHPYDSVRSNLIQTSAWQTGYVSYDGHGSAAQVGNGRENFIRASDAKWLTNETYPFFTALTCASGDDSLPGVRSLAGALVLNPVGGAIAALAPSGLSLDTEAQLFGNAFVDSFFGNDETIGEAVNNARLSTMDTVPAFMHRMYLVVGEPALHPR